MQADVVVVKDHISHHHHHHHHRPREYGILVDKHVWCVLFVRIKARIFHRDDATLIATNFAKRIFEVRMCILSV